MNTKQKTGLAIGAAVIGIGAAFGVGYAFSGAATNSQAQTQPSQGSGQGEGPGGGGQGRGGGMGNMSNFAKALAEKLGVDESKVIAALQEAMQGSRPSGDASQGAQPGGGASPGAMPSGAPSNGTGGGGPNGGGGPGGGSGMAEQLAKTLAEKLGLDEDKVAKAIEEVRSEQQADQPSRDASQASQPSASPSAPCNPHTPATGQPFVPASKHSTKPPRLSISRTTNPTLIASGACASEMPPPRPRFASISPSPPSRRATLTKWLCEIP